MGAIQNSLNQILASTLGAGFVVTQSPGIKERIATNAEVRKLAAQQKTLEKAESIGPLDAEQEKAFREKALDASEKAFELKPSVETFNAMKKQMSRQPKSFPAYESYEDYYGSEDYQQEIGQEASKRAFEQKREQDIQRILQGEQNAIDAKRGVKNAVSERKALLEQLAQAGVIRKVGAKIDNPAIKIADNKAGEEIKR